MSTHKTVNSLSKGKRKIKRPRRNISTKGLDQRSFTRAWTLSDDTEVRSVGFDDGLLTIVLGKIVPESHKRKDWF